MIPNSLIETTNQSLPSWIRNTNPFPPNTRPRAQLTAPRKTGATSWCLASASSSGHILSENMSNITSPLSKNTKFLAGPSPRVTPSGPDIPNYKSWTKNSEEWDSLARNSSATKTLLSSRSAKLNSKPTSTISPAQTNPSFTDSLSRSRTANSISL